MTVTVGILGATGYTGGELVRLLARHPQVTISLVTSEQYAGQPLEKPFPHLRGLGPLICRKLEVEEVADKCQVVFCALPHMASMDPVATLLSRGCRVIDLSADFRLKDAHTFATWYGEEHRAVALLTEAVYGLSELNRPAIRQARLVANPGCYPTSVVLPMAPLLAQGLVETEGIVVDSKSGVSGAGRSPGKGNLFPEIAEGFRPYKVTGHRHIPEMEQELTLLAGQTVRIRFTPHLLPQIRGILSTLYLRLKGPFPPEGLLETMRAFYRNDPFVRILPAGEYPSTNQVKGSNCCDIGLALDERTGILVVLSAIDNLVKGAAGQAVQNMNIMLGFEETTGLAQLPLFP